MAENTPEVAPVKKTRKKRVYNQIRQMNWLMWRMLSEHKCCFCAESLLKGYDPKKVNVTVHHLEGSIHTDDRTQPAPITEQLFAHSSCHKAYHHMERMIADGKNVDKVRFRGMEKNIKREVKRLEKLVA